MDKVENPYLAVLDRVHRLDRSIHVLSLVNNDLRHILHKQSVEFVRLILSISIFQCLSANLSPNSSRIPSSGHRLLDLRRRLPCRHQHLSVSEKPLTPEHFIRPVTPIHVESEEVRLAANILDKAKRTIEVSTGRKRRRSYSILHMLFLPLSRTLVRRNRNKQLLWFELVQYPFSQFPLRFVARNLHLRFVQRRVIPLRHRFPMHRRLNHRLHP